MTASLDVQNPWPGLDAYDEASSAFFYGRREEASELLRIIRLAPLTVMYGKSGLGKTSLLQAGLFPLLRADHYLPVHLRLDFSDPTKDPPLAQVMRRLQAELDCAKADYSTPGGDEGLWEYLHRKDFEIWSADNFPLVPVLVFDQFEELFSRSGNPDLIRQIFEELADLIENRIPAEFATEGAAPRRSRLDLLSQRYRIVLSFREDFLPQVRTWEKQVPSLLRNYLRLEPMSRQRAIDAVERAGQQVLSPGVAPWIVDFVGKLDSGEHTTETPDMVIEPVLLSLCCYQLNRRRAGGSRIDKALVDAAGQDILNSFYREALGDPDVKGPPDVAFFIEDHLIQGDHFRGDYPKDEALEEGKLTRAQLAALTDRHRLLRIVPHADTARVELIHDRLVPVVRAARDERRIAQHQKEQERQAREAQAERDQERARREELQRERDKANRNLVVATRRRNIALVATLVSVCSLGLVGYFLVTARQENRNKQIMAVAMDTSRLVEGRLALGAGGEPLEQMMYRGLAAYRLTDEGVSQTRAASLTALHSVLEVSGHLRKIVTIGGLVPTPALAYSPEGKLIAVGGEDGLIRLLDADAERETDREPYREVSRLDCGQSRGESAWALAFNGDGTRLAAGYSTGDEKTPGDGLVCVFNVSQRSVLRKWSAKALWAKPGDIYSVAYGGAPGMDFVVSGGNDKTLRVLDVDTGKAHELPHQETVVAVAASADGRTLASAGEDGIIRVWNAADAGNPDARPVELKRHEATIQQIAFSRADPNVLVSAGDDGRIFVWDVKQRCVAQQSKQQPARIYGVAVSPTGEFIAAAGADETVRLFALLALEKSPPCTVASASRSVPPEPPEFDVAADGVLSGHGGLVLAAAFNPKGDRLASAGQDGSIRIWGPKTGGFSLADLRFKAADGQTSMARGVTTVAISLDGKSVAAGTEDGDIHLWNVPETILEPVNHPEAVKWKAHEAPIRSLAYIRIGDRLALVSGGDDGVLKRWDATSRDAIGADMQDGAGPIRSIAVSPDGLMLLAGSSDGTIRLWDAAQGTRVKRFERPLEASKDYELSVAGFTGDGKHVAVADASGLHVLDLDQPGSNRLLQGHTDAVKALSHGGARWLLSAALDGSVLEWQAAALSRARAQGLKKHDEFYVRMRFREGKPLTAVDASADGDLILTGGSEGQIQLWDGGEHVLVGAHFVGHGGDIRAVALAPDDSFFVTADASTILLWPGPKRWAEIICSKLVWNMSREQWQAWVSPDIPYQDQCPGLMIAPDDPSSGAKSVAR